MQRRLLLSTAVAAPLVMAGCAGPQMADFAGQKPVLDLAEYFNGRIDGYGMFQDRSGNVVKRFTVVMDCSWTGNTGVLDEAFTYSDGTTERRVWTLIRGENGSYTGTAGDVVGVAKGQTAGNAFHWNYTLNLPVDGKTWEVQLDDWMYLIDERVMLNRARMSKWGVYLGEITLSFTRRGP